MKMFKQLALATGVVALSILPTAASDGYPPEAEILKSIEGELTALQKKLDGIMVGRGLRGWQMEYKLQAPNGDVLAARFLTASAVSAGSDRCSVTAGSGSIIFQSGPQYMVWCDGSAPSDGKLSWDLYQLSLNGSFNWLTGMQDILCTEPYVNPVAQAAFCS